MPYIKEREEIDKRLEPILNLSLDVGEINYIFTKILLGYSPKCYKEYNDLIGVLECCKLEFYRKQVSFYEEQKEKENGTVW